MDAVHDLGGMHGFGTVVEPGSSDIFHADWEPRLFGVWAAAYAKGLLAGNGRYWREQMAPAEYLAAGYYERWLWSTERQLVAKRAITHEELDAAAARLERVERAASGADPGSADAMRRFLDTPEPLHEVDAPRFAPGERVRVSRSRELAHNRCPRYVRGAVGIVERVQCADRVPAGSGAIEPVYLVVFASSELFGASAEPAWTVSLDLWEHYLEPAPEGPPTGTPR